MIRSPASSSNSAPRLSGTTSEISTPRRRMFVTAGVTANSYITRNGDYSAYTAKTEPRAKQMGAQIFSAYLREAQNRKTLSIDPFDYPAMRTPISLSLFFCVVLAGFASASAQELTEIYRVGAGDVLDIRLLNAVNRNSTLFTVDGGGVIDLPV